MPLSPSGRPALLGILNITRDSFSDGGRFLAPDAAVAQARALHRAGAAMIDLGPASTHPDAEPVTPDEEIRRLAPVVAALRADAIPVSVDTYHAQTQRWAIDAGVDAINDIQGFPDPALYAALAASSCSLIVMHSIQRRGKATRADVDADTIFDQITAFFDDRLGALEGAGVARQRVVVDPGMGFFLGQDPECSLTVLRRLPELRVRYRVPVLVSVSRKSFLRRLTGCSLEEVGPPTLAAELFSAAQGVDWIRTHDVAGLAHALAVQDAILY